MHCETMAWTDLSMGTSRVGSIEERRDEIPEPRRPDMRRTAAVAEVLRL